MSYVPDAGLLRGLPLEKAQLYGMPHLGARYTRDDTDAYALEDGALCAGCGRLAANTHHEPPKSSGRSFLLATDWGIFVLKPALIALCGSGTTGCHGRRHRNILRIRWEWDSDESAEQWWTGWMLSHECAANSPGLFRYGRYVIASGGRTWEVRR